MGGLARPIRLETKALNFLWTRVIALMPVGCREGLWCDIFGHKNCRMCSHDCDAFCEGEDECSCHRCPETSGSEALRCTLGDGMACYDQVSPRLAAVTTDDGAYLDDLQRVPGHYITLGLVGACSACFPSWLLLDLSASSPRPGYWCALGNR